MSQTLLILLLLTVLAATYAPAQAAPQAITVYVHADQPSANTPVTATSGQQVVNAMTDANGIAHLPIGAGTWVVETCGQSLQVETLGGDDGMPGLLVFGCYRSLLPVAIK